MTNVTNKEIKLAMEDLFNTANQFLGGKIDVVDTKISALDARISAMDNKLDLIMAKISKVADSSNSYVRTLNTVRTNSYNSVNGKFRFVCKHEVTMTKKRYQALILRCRELDIKLSCPECAEKIARAKYAGFINEFGRLPNSEELAIMKEEKKAQRQALNDELAAVREERKAMLAEKVELERQAYISTHYTQG